MPETSGVRRACSLLRGGAPDLEVMGIHILMKAVPFEVLEPAEPIETIRAPWVRLDAVLARCRGAYGGRVPNP